MKTPHKIEKLNDVKISSLSLLMIVATNLPAVLVALLQWSRQGQKWDIGWQTIVGTGAAVILVFAVAHLPAIWWWGKTCYRHRTAFVFFVILPVIASSAAAAILSAWGGLVPALINGVFCIDDIYTVAVALSFPPGGKFNEVVDQDHGRLIQVQYDEKSKSYIYEPRSPRIWE